MDAGRRWSLETFGAQGPLIRERVPTLVQDLHRAMADAQEASGLRSRAVYGQIWRGLVECFEEFGHLSGAVLVSPGKAPYRIPVVNGVAIFPWRYGDGTQGAAAEITFATSDARTALLTLAPVPVQPEFDLGLTEPDLSDDERQLLVDLLSGGSFEYRLRVVVVAVASSMAGIQEVVWGDVELASDGCLAFTWREALVQSAAGQLTAIDSGTRTFSAGDLPKKNLRMQGEDETRAEDE